MAEEIEGVDYDEVILNELLVLVNCLQKIEFICNRAKMFRKDEKDIEEILDITKWALNPLQRPPVLIKIKVLTGTERGGFVNVQVICMRGVVREGVRFYGRQERERKRKADQRRG